MRRERPILFSGPMVRALLDGRKTQTRRVVKPQPVKDGHFWTLFGAGWSGTYCPAVPGHSLAVRGPYGGPGDRLWVREAFDVGMTSSRQWVRYRADDSVAPIGDEHREALLDNWDNHPSPRWRPSIHMPRWASRLTLELTGVRVERVQDISEADAIAEGCSGIGGTGYDECESPRDEYRRLWSDINGPASWDANPWVWVLKFAVTGRTA